MHKDRPSETAAQKIAEATLQKGSEPEPSEIDELNMLFGRQASRKAPVEAAGPAEVIAAKEQPPSELEPVEEKAPAEAAKEEQPPADIETQELMLSDDVRLALTTLDDRLVRALEVGDIRLVRAAWLLAQPEEYRIQRRQDLEALEQNGASPSPLLNSQEAVTLIRKGNRSAGVLSYGCALCRSSLMPAPLASPSRFRCPSSALTAEPLLSLSLSLSPSLPPSPPSLSGLLSGNPDPTGHRLKVMRDALRENANIVAIFWE